MLVCQLPLCGQSKFHVVGRGAPYNNSWRQGPWCLPYYFSLCVGGRRSRTADELWMFMAKLLTRLRKRHGGHKECWPRVRSVGPPSGPPGAYDDELDERQRWNQYESRTLDRCSTVSVRLFHLFQSVSQFPVIRSTLKSHGSVAEFPSFLMLHPPSPELRGPVRFQYR